MVISFILLHCFVDFHFFVARGKNLPKSKHFYILVPKVTVKRHYLSELWSHGGGLCVSGPGDKKRIITFMSAVII